MRSPSRDRRSTPPLASAACSVARLHLASTRPTPAPLPRQAHPDARSGPSRVSSLGSGAAARATADHHARSQNEARGAEDGCVKPTQILLLRGLDAHVFFTRFGTGEARFAH